MAYAHYDRLTALDTVFLELEEPSVHMHVGSVGIFEGGDLVRDGGLDLDQVCAIAEADLRRAPRFRQRLARIPLTGRPVWVDDDHFNILYHVRHASLPLPGDEQWIDSFLATNSYGQSIAITPIQMITAISALANDGRMMQPYIVQEIRRGNNRYVHEPQEISRPISEETARQLTAMATNALNTAIPAAQVPGYTIAGKTGTAQIPENGVYHPDDVIGTFAGWLPADRAGQQRALRPAVVPAGAAGSGDDGRHGLFIVVGGAPSGVCRAAPRRV